MNSLKTLLILTIFIISNASLFSLAYSKEVLNNQEEKSCVKIINDRMIEKHLRKEGMKIVKNKLAVSGKILTEQLKNKKTKIKLNKAWTFSSGPDVLYQKSSKSVLTITSLKDCENCGNCVTSAGGFVISENGAAVTNHHVIEAYQDSKAVIAMNADNEVFVVTKVLAADANADIAIIELNHGKSKFKPLPIAKKALIGENINIISHPNDNYFVLTSGVASRYVRDEDHKDTFWLSVTAEYAKGSSGSPIFNKRDKLLVSSV